jgi:hypothetical protein
MMKMNRFADWLLTPVLSRERNRWFRYGSKFGTDQALAVIDKELKHINRMLLNPRSLDQQIYLKRIKSEFEILKQRIANR